MLQTTIRVIRAVIESAPTLTAEAGRAALQALVDASGEQNRQLPLVLRPKEAARLLSVTPRTLLNLRDSGMLHTVKLPGRKRALGYRRDEVEALADVNLGTPASGPIGLGQGGKGQRNGDEGPRPARTRRQRIAREDSE